MSTMSNPQSYGGSPERYIPKVQERKMQAKTDWAELVRYQQAIAEQMVQQENARRMQQKNEFRNALGSMVNEKQAMRSMELQNKQNEFVQSVTAKEELDQYLAKAKEHKNEFQKALIAEYDRERMEKEMLKKNMTNADKQMEQKLVADALDRLAQERAMKQQKRQEFMQITDQTIKEAEMKKRRGMELAVQNKQEHLRLQEENNFNQDMKDLNYKLYYQRISDKQNNLQQLYDKKAGYEERCRDNHIQDLVNRGVMEATQKAAEEEMRRQARRDEQFKSTLDDVKSRIEYHEQEKLQKKAEYQQKNEQRRRQEQEIAQENSMVKQLKATQLYDYKSTLQQQMREAEELKRKQQAEMSDYEKKMLLQNYESALIPGLRSSKFDNMIQPQLRTTGPFSPTQFTPMPQFSGTGQGSPNAFGRSSLGDINNAGQVANGAGSSSPYGNYPKVEVYNPITNPVPNNLQNPYIVRDIQRGMYSPRNYLAVMADKNLIASASMAK